MFTFLVAQSLKNRLLVLAISLLLIIAGVAAVRGLAVDVLPDLNRPQVTIMTEAPGLAPVEVESLVSFPVETAMNGAPGVTRVRSQSAAGLSVVTVEFDWGTDIYRNRQLITERMGLIEGQLPPVAHMQLAPISSMMGEILFFAVTRADGDMLAARELADFTLRPRLLTIPGVSQVIPLGGAVKQYRIAPDSAAMARLGVSLDDIVKAADGFGRNAGGGFVDQRSQEFLVRTVAQTRGIKDLAQIVVATRDGRTIQLGQVARVEVAGKPPRGTGGYKGGPAVIVSVLKQPGADTLPLTREVEAALSALQKTLPPGVKVDQVIFRQADFISRSLENVQKVLIEAIIVVAIVLFAFLLNWRTTAISLAAIPVSLLVTALVFYGFGLTINTMTLGGIAIAIGSLVDDAVVDVENVYRRLRENAVKAMPDPVLSVIAAASNEVRSGILYATIIVVLAFAPLFALSGLEGRLFAPLGVAYAVAILASLVISITLTPVLCSYLLPKRLEAAHQDGKLLVWLKGRAQSLIAWGFRRDRWVMGAAVAIGLAGVAALLGLPRSFLPTFNEGSYTIGVTLNPGTSLAESDRIGRLAEQLIARVPEVTATGRRTGRAELDEHGAGVYAGEIEVALTLKDRPQEAVVADVRRQLAALPVAVNVGQPISHRIDHMLSGVRAEIAIKVYGEDLDTLIRLAEQLRGQVAGIPGLADVQVERITRVPQLDISVDVERAAQFGVGPQAVTGALASLSNGMAVSQIVEGDRRIDVVIRLDDSERTTEALGDLLVETPGGRIALSQIATIEERDGPNQVLRENGKRRVTVLMNTAGRAPSVIVADIRAILEQTTLPSGYFASLEGTFQAQEEAGRLILLLGALALGLIFAVLASRYRSGVLALIIMSNLPLALVGGVAALLIAGLPLSVASMVGFVTLAGIAARNGILKVSHYINLVLFEGERFDDAMILRGSRERLTPVLMTALSAGLALIPLMIGGDEPGKEILHPVAVTIFGGLLSATLLDTLLTPVLFRRFGRAALERLQATEDASTQRSAF
jgi:heavy-metal exporter, HME family